MDVNRIARELGVSNVLQGNLRMAATGVRGKLAVAGSVEVCKGSKADSTVTVSIRPLLGLKRT